MVAQQGDRGRSTWILFPNPEELLKDLFLYLLEKKRERECVSAHPQAGRGAEGEGEREREKQTSG